MNPCPCGYSSDPKRYCRCAPTQLQYCQKRLSGPLLDHIGLQEEELPALSSVAEVETPCQLPSDQRKQLALAGSIRASITPLAAGR